MGKSCTRTISVNQAVELLNNGEIIIYPTEAVYGLGCDPKNNKALEQLLKLKSRDISKGLVLIASNIKQLDFYIDYSSLTPEIIEKIKKSWDTTSNFTTFITWVLPINKSNIKFINPIIYGSYNTIAVRVSSNQIVQDLCNKFNNPIVSTSANITGQPEIKDKQRLLDSKLFANIKIVDGNVGGFDKPSTIINGITGQKIR